MKRSAPFGWSFSFTWRLLSRESVRESNPDAICDAMARAGNRSLGTNFGPKRSRCIGLDGTGLSHVGRRCPIRSGAGPVVADGESARGFGPPTKASPRRDGLPGSLRARLSDLLGGVRPLRGRYRRSRMLSLGIASAAQARAHPLLVR